MNHTVPTRHNLIPKQTLKGDSGPLCVCKGLVQVCLLKINESVCPWSARNLLWVCLVSTPCVRFCTEKWHRYIFFLTAFFKPRSLYFSNTHIETYGIFLKRFQGLLSKSGFSFYVRSVSALDKSGVCLEWALGPHSRPKADSQRHRKHTSVWLGALSFRFGLVGIVVKENNALRVRRQAPIFV